MAGSKNNNYVSFWFWMLAIFIAALPCVGFIMIIVWAFQGDNESRKNYFRAVLAWMLIVAVIWGGLMVFGFWPEIQRRLQQAVPVSQVAKPRPRH